MDTPCISILRRLRKTAGLTQNQLAKVSGIDARRIRRLETGEIAPENLTLKNAIALAAALGVHPEELLDAPAPKAE